MPSDPISIGGKIQFHRTLLRVYTHNIHANWQEFMSRIMNIVSCRLPMKFEEQWNRWHNEKHIPMVLRQPGFMNVGKFRCLSNNKQEVEYFVLYELRNQAAYDNYVKSEEAPVYGSIISMLMVQKQRWFDGNVRNFYPRKITA